MSRWANWSTGTETKPLMFSRFQQLVEQGRPVDGDPNQIIQQNGWQHKGYGYYVDGSGQTVARVMDGQLYMFDGEPNQIDKQVDAGNPTPAGSGMKPADRARSMGLQSDGRGGYIDPQSGQKVARTVNNELVFYDQRPGGGAVSDGAGGQALAQDTPSWQDPVTGLVVTPPAKPESAQEIAMVPDPVPAQAPHGFNDFVQSAKLKAYASQKVQQDIETEVSETQAAVDQAYASHPAMDELKVQFQMVIDKANQSGDPQKMEIASRVTDIMNNGAEEFKSHFDVVPEEQHQELADNIKKFAIQRAKQDAFEADPAVIAADDLYDQGDIDGYEEAMSTVQLQPGNVRPYEKAIEDMVDTANGVEEIQPLSPGDIQKQYAGKYTTYFFDKKNDFQKPGEGGSVDFDEDMVVDVLDKAGDITREFGLKDPKDVYEVEWTVGDDSEDNKRIALDAMQTWRDEVLPNLPDGLVLFSKTDQGGDGVRERIYQMAGFSGIQPEYDNGQLGVVVTQNGQKTVVPVTMGDEDMEESYRIQQLDKVLIENVSSDLDDYTINNVYGALIG